MRLNQLGLQTAMTGPVAAAILHRLEGPFPSQDAQRLFWDLYIYAQAEAQTLSDSATEFLGATDPAEDPWSYLCILGMLAVLEKPIPIVHDQILQAALSSPKLETADRFQFMRVVLACKMFEFPLPVEVIKRARHVASTLETTNAVSLRLRDSILDRV